MFGMLLKHSPLSKDAGGRFSVFSLGNLFRPGMEGYSPGEMIPMPILSSSRPGGCIAEHEVDLPSSDW
jgi:hypothetical protein